MKKILDQYTDRTDLTGMQKFALRHPGYQKAKYAKDPKKYLEAHRQWREANPEKYAAQSKKDNRLHTHRAILSRTKVYAGKKDTISTARRNEIIRLHETGRDVGRIAVWMNIPVSQVVTIIAAAPNIVQ